MPLSIAQPLFSGSFKAMFVSYIFKGYVVHDLLVSSLRSAPRGCLTSFPAPAVSGAAEDDFVRGKNLIPSQETSSVRMSQGKQGSSLPFLASSVCLSVCSHVGLPAACSPMACPA